MLEIGDYGQRLLVFLAAEWGWGGVRNLSLPSSKNIPRIFSSVDWSNVFVIFVSTL